MLKSITIILVGGSFLMNSCKENYKNNTSDPVTCESVTEKEVALGYNDSLWKEVKFSKNIYKQMVYANKDNFTKEKIYPCARCFLRPEVAQALALAQKSANELGLTLLVFDCYRPKEFQEKMYNIVNNPKYVAKPKGKGSMHNRGLAVDLALSDTNGVILDFGGNFDDFSENAHHDFKDISANARRNRKLLKKIMQDAGFTFYQFEWWHYNYKHVDYSLDDFIWDCS